MFGIETHMSLKVLGHIFLGL